MPRLDYSFGIPHDVCRFARWQYPYSGYSMPIHTHAYHEIFWVEAGEGLHLINDERRRLYPGLLVLIRPEDRHGFSAERDGEVVKFSNFAFDSALWHSLRRRHPSLANGLFEQRDHRRREFDLDAAQVERLRVMAHDLEAGARDVLSTESFLAGLMALLINARHQQGAIPAWLDKACKRIAEPAHFVGGVPEFARLAGRSPEHVARATKRLLKKTPTEIVNEARLAFAAKQLCSSTHEIIDIAAACGLENLGHFYKLFRQRFGITPQRYRKHAYQPTELRVADGKTSARTGRVSA